jgi:hypothetical protein
MRHWLTLSLILLLTSCSSKQTEPPVNSEAVPLKTVRFETFFFEDKSLFSRDAASKIEAEYPVFGPIFLAEIVNADPQWTVDSVNNYLKGYRDSYRAVYDSAKEMFSDFKPYEREIQTGMRWFKHYFPKQPLPKQIITYVGPLDGYGDLITQDAMVIGLHHHLGGRHSFYQSGWLQETYPAYISRRFEPATISVNAMVNLLMDLYPEHLENKTLVQQMIEKGKRLYALQQLLPEKDPNWLIGYSSKQWSDCLSHEKEIWNLFVENQMLQETNLVIIKNYIGESPKTQELGEASPGNIGSFVGWRIVEKFMKKSGSSSLEELMKTDAEKIMEIARYKP